MGLWCAFALFIKMIKITNLYHIYFFFHYIIIWIIIVIIWLIIVCKIIPRNNLPNKGKPKGDNSMLLKGTLEITRFSKSFPTWDFYGESFTAWSLGFRSLIHGRVLCLVIEHWKSYTNWHEVIVKQTFFNQHIMNMLNNPKGPPKEIINLIKRTKGSPKVILNYYGDRAYNSTRFLIGNKKYKLSNINWRGSVAVSNKFQRRYYSSVENNNVLSKLEKITILSKQHPTGIIDRGLYSLLTKEDLFIIAYEKLKSKPGNITSALDESTLDGFSKETIKSITNAISTNTFKFKPSRRLLIPKPNGGTRPITIASPIDKIVLEVIRNILERIFEPLFLETNHGFRPNKGCHTALKYIDTHFKVARVIIEGDISNYFDTIDHNILLNLLRKRIKDTKFIELIQKALKCGYGELHEPIKNNLIGSPQGSPLSPLLSNIYLNQFDMFIEQLKKTFNKGIKPQRNKEYRRVAGLLLRNPEKAKKLNVSKKTLLKLPFFYDNINTNFKKLVYVRYVDAFIIGIRGSVEDATYIKKECQYFLENYLKLLLNEEKTLLTCFMKKQVLFLGTYISLKNFNGLETLQYKGLTYKKRKGLSIRFEAPLEHIWNKLRDSGYCIGFEPKAKHVLIPYTKEQIVDHYNSVLRGILNYYSFASNRGALVSLIRYVLWKSCSRTLAIKYKLKRTSKVIKRFGKDFKGQSQIGFLKVNSKLIKGSKRFNIKNPDNNNNVIFGFFGAPKSLSTLNNLICLKCGSSTQVEMHHIRKRADVSKKTDVFSRLMIQNKRKPISLCRKCHLEVHGKTVKI